MIVIPRGPIAHAALALFLPLVLAAQPAILTSAALDRSVAFFNAMENEPVVNAIPNAESAAWLRANIPLLDCPDADLTEIYFFRWWSFRKHLRRDPDTGGRFALTEFITKPRPVSSALGHHLAEGRWLRDPRYLDETALYWLRGGPDGGPQPHLHKYSQWTAYAVWQRALATGDKKFAVSLLDDLVRDYAQWEKEKQRPDGLFWQNDVWDAMEESISGGRKAKNIRPTINSYMFGNAQAIAALARLAGRAKLAVEFDAKAAALKQLMLATLWDADAKFFKVRPAAGGALSDAREAIGFLPWYFHLPGAGIAAGYEAAWAQFTDERGFRAPFGLTTAERRHPLFRSHGTGTCEWDGAAWPFATSQTLTALANFLHDSPAQGVVSGRDWFDAFITYTRSQRYDGRPYIGEYLDETTGQWLKGRNERSRYYNHSTFADLVVTGLAGLRPRADDTVELAPLLPSDTWPWFCLDGVPYHGRSLTILWDRDGARYGHGAGLHVLADGKEIAHAATVMPLLGKLP